MSKHLLERFAEKVAVDTKSRCWEWTAYTNHDGYGQLKVNGRMVSAHRFSCQTFNGDVPEGMSVLHTCDNPGCVNPEHLFLGTHQDNMDDKVAKSRQLRGTDIPQAKLTDRDVALIRLLKQRHAVHGCGVQRFMARWFGVSTSQISNVIQGRYWSDSDN